MCGIVGKINLNHRPVTLPEIKKMTDAIEHRGPDDEGQWAEENVGLGNRRLAIIDLSKNGHMPMFYGRNRYVITFNGEIYNFKEEQKKLIKKGYKFRSNSDTEVILALYSEYGVKCLDHLRGMFAFSIWDRKDKVLFAARDRVGKKPLKYYIDKDKFIFASELKAILTQAGVKRIPDYKAIYHYLSFQYVPSPWTGFEKIFKLPPAHYLILKNNVLSIHKYWELDYTQKLDHTEDEWKELVTNKLNESVKLRMIADVPIGAFLSGGVDSSLVVALMAQNSKQPIKTFSIGFKEAKFNELSYAKKIAERYQTDHTEFIVEPNAMDILPNLVRQYEEPYADSSALPSYYVSQLTRQHVTVALNGDGGDENFAGYGWYPIYSLTRSKLIEDAPILIKQAVSGFSQLALKLSPSTTLYRFKKLTDSLFEDPYERYLRYICYFTEDQKKALIRPKLNQIINQDSRDLIYGLFNNKLAIDPLDQALHTDINSYLPDDLLVKMDIATMMNSLEGRSPFLDHELLELTAKIPGNLKINNFEKKYLLKKIAEDYIPKGNIYRQKRGFSIPIQSWFKDQLKSYSKEVLLNPNAMINSFVEPKEIRRLLEAHQDTEVNYAHHIWALLTLELWLQSYFNE